MKPITIYTKRGSLDCRRAKELLAVKLVRYQEIDVSDGGAPKREMLQRSNGACRTPQIFIGDRRIGGAAALYQLEREGQLDALLENEAPA